MKKAIIIIFILLIKSNLFSQALIHPFNLDFEDGDSGKIPVGWELPGWAVKLGYNAALTDKNPHSGKYCLEISNEYNPRKDGFGYVQQEIDAKPYRGKHVMFRAAVRADVMAPLNSANLFIRVFNKEGEKVFNASSRDEPVVLNFWQYDDIDGIIDAEAETITFGLMLRGSGKAWIDKASFEVINQNPAINEPPKPLNNQGLDNLIAFAKIFGYIRYYHPSSEGLEANWENLALAGVQLVENSDSPTQLADNLKKIFLPVAPSILIYPTSLGTKDKIDVQPPANSLKDVALAMKHVGPAAGIESKVFSSKPFNVIAAPKRNQRGCSPVA